MKSLGDMFANCLLEAEFTPNPFREGDIVRLKNGQKPLEVIKTKTGYIRTRYLGRPAYTDYSGREYDNGWRECTAFVLVARDGVVVEYYPGEKKEKTEMAKLYEIKDGVATVFGTLLAQNSKGRLVLEIKGTGEVRDFDPADVTEVVPYTVAVSISPDGVGRERTVVHYKCQAGALAVGDIIVFATGKFGRVTQIDTKKADGQSLKNARKMLTEVIGSLPEMPGEEE